MGSSDSEAHRLRDGIPVGLAALDPPCYGWTCQAGRCLRLPECVISALEWHALANIHDGSGIL